MALTARISLTGPPDTEPEDFLASSIGVIFPDDVTNQHGDAEHGLLYTSPHLPKPLHISLAEPKGDEDRRLFSHYLWNSSLLIAELVEAGTLGLSGVGDGPAVSPVSGGGGGGDNGKVTVVDSAPAAEFNIAGLATIELGAGTALCSLMSALLGASRVVVTDYPAPVVMKTLRRNVAANLQPSFSPSGRIVAMAEGGGDGGGVEVEGHGWGEFDTPLARANKHAFDRVFVSDCLWMPWQHDNLRKSIAWFLKADAASRAWVVAGFHTGREKMRGFFDAEALAGEGLEVERIWERDCNGFDREWVLDRGVEDVTERKRWLVVAVLRILMSGAVRDPG